MNMIRSGMGFDVHRLVRGRRLVLGGVEVHYEYGLEGHSDADVLVHSIMDAILGAMGQGDIGIHFPDNDPTYKDAVSMELLGKVFSWAKEEGFIINNLDCVIVAQRPKLFPYIAEMRRNIAMILEADEARINIKATTTEGLGFCGRGEGISAFSIVTMIKEQNDGYKTV